MRGLQIVERKAAARAPSGFLRSKQTSGDPAAFSELLAPSGVLRGEEKAYRCRRRGRIRGEERLGEEESPL